MDFFDLYNSFESSYEVGIGIEAKNYLNSIEDVKDYSIKFIKNELVIIVNYKGDSIHGFVFDFLCFISYKYYCLIHKEETRENICYYIFTQMSEDIVGMKIKMIFPK